MSSTLVSRTISVLPQFLTSSTVRTLSTFSKGSGVGSSPLMSSLLHAPGPSTLKRTITTQWNNKTHAPPGQPYKEVTFSTPHTLSQSQASSTASFKALVKIGRSEQEATEVAQTTDNPDSVEVIELRKGDKLYGVAVHTADRSGSRYWMDGATLSQMMMFKSIATLGDRLDGRHDPHQMQQDLALPGDNTAEFLHVSIVQQDCEAVKTTAGPTTSKVSLIDPQSGVASGSVDYSRPGGGSQVTPPPGVLTSSRVLTSEEVGDLVRSILPQPDGYSMHK